MSVSQQPQRNVQPHVGDHVKHLRRDEEGIIKEQVGPEGRRFMVQWGPKARRGFVDLRFERGHSKNPTWEIVPADLSSRHPPEFGREVKDLLDLKPSFDIHHMIQAIRTNLAVSYLQKNLQEYPVSDEVYQLFQTGFVDANDGRFPLAIGSSKIMLKRVLAAGANGAITKANRNETNFVLKSPLFQSAITTLLAEPLALMKDTPLILNRKGKLLKQLQARKITGLMVVKLLTLKEDTNEMLTQRGEAGRKDQGDHWNPTLNDFQIGALLAFSWYFNNALAADDDVSSFLIECFTHAYLYRKALEGPKPIKVLPRPYILAHVQHASLKTTIPIFQYLQF